MPPIAAASSAPCACSTSSRSPRRSCAAARRRGARNASASAQQDAADFLLLLLLERDDVVVDLDRAQRLEEQARAAGRAAVHDAGDRGAVLGADDEHVAAVAIGDDLLLQVLRRVLAAQVRLERAAQARALLAQAVAQALQLRARIVDDLAGGVDLARGRRRSRARTTAASDDPAPSRGNAARWRRMPETVASIGREEGGERRAVQRLERRVRRRRAPRGSPRARPARAAGSRRCRRGSARFRRSSARAAATARGSSDGMQRGQPLGARRRLREPADGLDNPIEFEGLAARRRACQIRW